MEILRNNWIDLNIHSSYTIKILFQGKTIKIETFFCFLLFCYKSSSGFKLRFLIILQIILTLHCFVFLPSSSFCVLCLKFGLEIMIVNNNFQFGEGKEIVMVRSWDKLVLLRNMNESRKCVLGLLFSVEFSLGFVKRHFNYLNRKITLSEF